MSEQQWLNEFADNLSFLMDEQYLSQRELARKTGLSPSTINRFLQAQTMPTAKAIVNIAYVLDVDVDELIDFGEMID